LYLLWFFFSPILNKEQFPFVKNSVVELELNMNEKTLYFFLNNKQIPYFIYNISSSPLSFGISGLNTNSSIEIISLLKLHKPTINNNIPSEKIEWQ
jgi:hypothetical protein